MNDLHDPEADVGRDGHAAERERLAKLLYSAGPRRVPGRARSIWRFMAEPVLIAAAALVGALIGAYYHSGYGDYPVIGTAGAMAGLANAVGMGMFLLRWSRAGSRVLGSIVIRVAVMLLCVGAEFYGLTCVCDDVSHEVYLPAITVE